MIHEVGNIELCELIETEPKNAVQSMFIILGQLASPIARAGTSCVKEDGISEIHQVHDGPSLNSRVRHQERTTSRISIWQEAGRQRITYGSPVEEEMQKRGISNVSTTDSYEIQYSVVE